MNRALAASPIGLLAFIAALTLTAYAVRRGLVADDTVTLWAGAISAGSGEVPVGRIIASYPTLPFLVTTLLEFVTPAGAPAPALAAAGVLALLSCAWFRAFRVTGLSLGVAATATLLVALHPVDARRLSCRRGRDVPDRISLSVRRALFDMRARTAAPEVMAVGLSLLGLAFSHPIGAAIVVAGVPCLVFAVRPTLVANSAANVLLALVFPTVFAIGAFAYVSWVFPGSGWSFLAAPAESLAGWSVGAARIFRRLDGFARARCTLAVAAALVLGAPIAPIVVGWVRERRPLVVPPAVFAATIVIAAAVAVATGLFGSPAPLAAAAPILAGAVVARVPDLRERPRTVLALLVAGWFGGILGLALVEPRTTEQVNAALSRNMTDQERRDALALGGATIKHDGVLVDTDNAPAVVLGRGKATGLIAPRDPRYALAMLLARFGYCHSSQSPTRSPAPAFAIKSTRHSRPSIETADRAIG